MVRVKESAADMDRTDSPVRDRFEALRRTARAGACRGVKWSRRAGVTLAVTALTLPATAAAQAGGGGGGAGFCGSEGGQLLGDLGMSVIGLALLGFFAVFAVGLVMFTATPTGGSRSGGRSILSKGIAGVVLFGVGVMLLFYVMGRTPLSLGAFSQCIPLVP